ncbi:MAG: hypothetical protein ACP5H2_09580 [Solirubrobacteraceae bacterium]
MPPTDRFVITFAAEPPQHELPYGRWADMLAEQFTVACADIDSEGEEVGTPQEIRWFPDRTYAGRTYVPAVSRTEQGYDLFGYVAFTDAGDGPEQFEARADFTGDTAEENPDWQIDLNEMVVGVWRGEAGHVAEMTLIWGVPLVSGGEIITAELADHAVDQCQLVEDRFTLLAPDNYLEDYLQIKLWDRRGGELAMESLYLDDQEGSEDQD